MGFRVFSSGIVRNVFVPAAANSARVTRTNICSLGSSFPAARALSEPAFHTKRNSGSTITLASQGPGPPFPT